METDRIDDSIYNQQDVYTNSNSDYQQQAPRQQMYYTDPVAPPPTPEPVKKVSFFDEIDKNVWIMLFIAFILGFFMGKTMQPVILRQ